MKNPDPDLLALAVTPSTEARPSSDGKEAAAIESLLEQASADALNAGCFCASLDEQLLAQALEAEFGSPEIVRLVRERCPYLYSAHPVFVSGERMRQMGRVIAAVESVVALPAYRELVLGRSPQIAAHATGARGVFYGYDFHVAQDRLGLIEVNTNAGGAMLNAVLGRAHKACCAPVAPWGPSAAGAERFEQAMVDMFRAEWRLAGRPGPLRTLAIVDDNPGDQYLYPEFLLSQRLFERHGLRALIADPRDFTLEHGELHASGERVDLVYNRLTDFYLEAPAAQVLRETYLSGRVVITPHPQAHALYADKRNLVLLSDAAALEALGVPAATRDLLLQSVPRTLMVDASNAAELWAQRKRWFFKPVAGHGSRGAYRGDKLTQRVWSEIQAGGYVAQQLVAPGERTVAVDANQPLKFDLRHYVYDGEVQWSAARLYQGQTTNFRTPGGGFAPVYRGLC